MNFKDYYSKTGIPNQVSQVGIKASLKFSPKNQSTVVNCIVDGDNSFPIAEDPLNIKVSINKNIEYGFSTNTFQSAHTNNGTINIHRAGAHCLNLPT